MLEYIYVLIKTFSVQISVIFLKFNQEVTTIFVFLRRNSRIAELF